MNNNNKSSEMGRLTWLLPIGIIILFIVFVSKDVVNFWLNLLEFGDLFIKPLYFGMLGGLMLAMITLVRVDFRNRRSLTWWALRLTSGLVRAKDYSEISQIWFDFDGFKLPHRRFLVWQITKVLVGSLFFANIMFGMTVNAVFRGWEPGLNSLPGIFALPFVTPSLGGDYSEANVMPMIPSLTLIVPSLLQAFWLRLMLLVVVTHVTRFGAPLLRAYLMGYEAPSYDNFISVIEALSATLLLWFALSLFFTDYIDYNTRYLIIGFGAGGLALAVFAILDSRSGLDSRWASWAPDIFRRRVITTRLAPLVLIALAMLSLIIVNTSVADVRKVEWLGPYTAQSISVNRYLAELDQVTEQPYEFGLSSIPPGQIEAYVKDHEHLLSKVRLWDQQGSFDKLRPEIGLVPYVDFTESDILRFNNSLYWCASMDLILPTTVRPEDRWYATHFVYTHVPIGFLMLDGHSGRIVDPSDFFQQRRVYYGEEGLFKDTWVASPVGRTVSDEVTGHFYSGRGGVTISPPLSWVFEPNFLTSYPTTSMQVLRYRDVRERLSLLFPYFTYSFGGERLDIWPVTDGENTYWTTPLMVFLDAEKVPWGRGNQLGRLVGYALIDAYHGDVEIIVTGDDFFSQIFKTVYSEHVSTVVPEWLKPQLRYPEELFEWRINMFNYFHTTSPATFIEASEFYSVPRGIDTYYIVVQPPGFESQEFIGILSLELQGALGENLAGYAVVRNDYPYTGETLFYKVPLDARARLLGPTAINDALERNQDYASLKTLLRNPRLGDEIFYEIGDYDVFFIPVYTAPGGGVVTELGTIATVGADFIGDYHVGLGATIQDSFREFLRKMAGIDEPIIPPEGEEERLDRIVETIEGAGLTLLRPTAISPDASFQMGTARYTSEEEWEAAETLLDSFIDFCIDHDVARVYVWGADSGVNLGMMKRVGEVLELHYILLQIS